MVLLRVICLLMLVGLIQSCMDVAMSGAQAVYNRHSLQKNFKDQMITMEAYKSIKMNDPQYKDTNISIATYHGDVLLAGQVPDDWQRINAERKIKRIAEVKRVFNMVQLSSPSSALTRISDAWITAKVKSKLLMSDEVDATQVKVVTENGTVYLMGILPPEDAAAAVDVARDTDGVERVVKIFSYVKIVPA